VKRCPNPNPGEECQVEIRQVSEVEDFGLQFPPEMREREEKLRTELASRA
jgi:hypothetical protein